MKKNIFPFTAIVGQEKIKKALILNAINPSIGGVLIKGDRGTAKTTAVRSLPKLLPEIEIMENCVFNSDLDSYNEFELYQYYNKAPDECGIVKTPMRVVELPLGATEDRVVGSLDIEKALHEGIKALEPGILAQANRNILYIDEINLLDDNLVDVLLDAAAYGVNRIEREGISISHPSKFILVGTMNPEEGELREQLSDRIGLKISVTGIEDIDDRIEIMKRLAEFEANPEEFIGKYEAKERKLRDKIISAKELLPSVRISDDFIEIIARISRNLGVEGHRSDITILKTAKTLAAFNNNWKVSLNDLEEAILLVLGELNSCDSKEKVQNQIQQAQNEMNEENSKDNDPNNFSNDIDDTKNNQDNKDGDNEDNNENEASTDVSDDHDDNSLNNEKNGKYLDNFENSNDSNNSNDNSNSSNNSNNGKNLDDGLDDEKNESNDLDNDNQDKDYGDENQLQGEVNESDHIDNDYQMKYNENKSEKELKEFEIESLEKDIRKMLVMEGREKEKTYGSRVDSKTEKGKYVKSKYSPKTTSSDIAIDATLRAAALRSNQNTTTSNKKLKVNIKDRDIREKIRKHKARASIAIVIDMSGSMISEKKVNMIRGILDKVIKNINKNRDKLSVIGFKGKGSEVIIPNTKHPNSFLSKLDKITVGGTTPMAAGLEKALEILKVEKNNGEFIPMLILLSDGMPNVGLKSSNIKKVSGSPVNDVLAIGEELANIGIYTIVLDFEKKHKHGRNINMELAFTANGRYYDLEDVYNPDVAMDKILTYERNFL
jgi:Mg-chelatase subunit ChlI/Mg-chelatase subunit ChlD